MHECTKKDKMNKNIVLMTAKHGKPFEFTPKTYNLPQELSTLLRDSDVNKQSNKYYIVKPNGSSQGKGISVSNDVQAILARDISDTVVSEYIQNPLLINGLKFDLRIYALITSVHPLRIYVYEEGLVRFATEQFSLHPSHLSNSFVHLTNYSINKFSDKFVSGDGEGLGSKWTLSALKRTMKDIGLDGELMMVRIEDIIVKTILSIEHRVFKATDQFVPFRTNCFDLLGFDVLIDSELRPWLLEVNLSPSLACETEVDFRIKSEMVAEMFNVIGVPMDTDAKPAPHHINAKIGKQAIHESEIGNKYGASKEDRKRDIRVVQETRDEISRCVKFKPIFPSYNFAMYKQYFEEERPYNKILFDEITKNMSKLTA